MGIVVGGLKPYLDFFKVLLGEARLELVDYLEFVAFGRRHGVGGEQIGLLRLWGEAAFARGWTRIFAVSKSARLDIYGTEFESPLLDL